MRTTAFISSDRDSWAADSNSSIFVPSISSDRRELSEAIKKLPAISGECDYAPINDKTLAVALSFVANLPENRALPKAAVDEDGSILLMWAGANRTIALGVTIDGEVLRAVANPGRRSDHLGPKMFTGYIPPSLLSHVPTK